MFVLIFLVISVFQGDFKRKLNFIFILITFLDVSECLASRNHWYHTKPKHNRAYSFVPIIGFASKINQRNTDTCKFVQWSTQMMSVGSRPHILLQVAYIVIPCTWGNTTCLHFNELQWENKRCGDVGYDLITQYLIAVPQIFFW